MSYIYKNITGDTAELLLSMNKYNESIIPSILITNKHSTDQVSVELYITRTYVSEYDRISVGQDGNWDPLTTTTETYYILNNTKVPVFASLLLEQPELSFDNTKYDLYIRLASSDSAVDIIIGEPIEKGSSISSTMSTGSTSSSY